MGRVINVKEARKILGRDAEKLDDYQIENAIDTLSLIASEMLEKASRGELTPETQPGHSNLDSNAGVDERDE